MLVRPDLTYPLVSGAVLGSDRSRAQIRAPGSPLRPPALAAPGVQLVLNGRADVGVIHLTTGGQPVTTADAGFGREAVRQSLYGVAPRLAPGWPSRG